MLHVSTLVLISILLNRYANADSCENDNCSSSIDIPLISKLNAPLKAELDISSLTKQLREVIQKEVKVAVSKEIKDLVENFIDERIQTALESFGKLNNLTLSTLKQKIEDETAHIEESIASLYNRTVEFDSIISKQNICASDINLLTTMDNKLVVEIGQMKEKQKITESRMSLIEAKVKRTSEKRNIIRDCSDLNRNVHESGVYHIYPGGYKVYCDMKTSYHGGWTVFQYRSGGVVNFHNKGWKDYKNGFGEVSGEHWLGNERVHQLTASGNNCLRIYLEDWDGNSRYAEFRNFSVGDEISNYFLSYGPYRGSAGNGLANNMKFTTADRQNDNRKNGHNCASTKYYGGPWWYPSDCGYSDLNGEYVNGGKGLSAGKGVMWSKWKGFSYSLKVTKMMIRKI